jgi:hypothetical protein
MGRPDTGVPPAVSLEKLRSWVEAEEYRGYDPYDALNSPLLRSLGATGRYSRMILTQTLKHLPFNLRPLLGIRRGHNPKALGLFLWGYGKLYALDGSGRHLERIDRLLDLLEETGSRGWSGSCWGYNFDWQSRAFYLPRWTPTIVNTSFIGHALLDVYRLTGKERALHLALSVRNFLLADLNRTGGREAFCFSYTPLDRTAIHNANLLGASLLIRLHRHCQEAPVREAALAALAHTLSFQREDGSWPYAETSYQAVIDSFHTGFNLQALSWFLEEKEGGERCREALERGKAYYRDNFFLPDGGPKYYHDRAYPLDIHSSAQAIVYFSRQGEECRDLTDRLVRWMIDSLQDRRGYFYFRRTRFFTNRIPYMRWSQAWAFHALTEYTYRHEAPQRIKSTRAEHRGKGT